VWANSELDNLCFGGMRATTLDKPNKQLDILDKILSSNEWLVNNQFSVADVAVASYLNYVPLFFNRLVEFPSRVNYRIIIYRP
jgi:glutathione S-transferase/alpha,alpha-trehalase